MDNSIPKEASALAEMLKKAGEFRELVEKVKSGEGLGLSEEQKTEFVKQMAAEGPAQAVREVTAQFDNLQAALNNMKNYKAEAQKPKE